LVLTLKTPYREGTTHIVMSPLEFIQRLAALVPRPRLYLKAREGFRKRVFEIDIERTIAPSLQVKTRRPGITAVTGPQSRRARVVLTAGNDGRHARLLLLHQSVLGDAEFDFLICGGCYASTSRLTFQS